MEMQNSFQLIEASQLGSLIGYGESHVKFLYYNSPDFLPPAVLRPVGIGRKRKPAPLWLLSTVESWVKDLENKSQPPKNPELEQLCQGKGKRRPGRPRKLELAKADAGGAA